MNKKITELSITFFWMIFYGVISGLAWKAGWQGAVIGYNASLLYLIWREQSLKS